MEICYDHPRKGMELVINYFSYGGGFKVLFKQLNDGIGDGVRILLLLVY
nr:MAG TPA: hypothetical protein [Crassvirales sp.]